MCGVKKCPGVGNIETTKFLPFIELKNRRLAITTINDFCPLSSIEDDSLRGSVGVLRFITTERDGELQLVTS